MTATFSLPARAEHSVAPIFASAAQQFTADRNARTVRMFLQRLEQMDIPAWGALWAEDGRQDMPYAPPGFPTELVGKKRLLEHFSGLPKAMEYMRFPDLKLHLTGDPNVVIAEFRGDIKLANSNKKYDNTYINVFTFRPDGKIASVKEFFNPLVLIEGGAFENGKPKTGGDGATAPAGVDRAWAERFFAAVDKGSLQDLGAFFAEDIRLAFGKRAPIEGRPAVLDSFAYTRQQLQSVRHEIASVLTGQANGMEIVSIESTVIYTLKDGRVFAVPANSTLRIKDGLVHDYRIFIDTTPVFGQ